MCLRSSSCGSRLGDIRLKELVYGVTNFVRLTMWEISFMYKLGCKLRRDDSVLPDKDHCKRKGKGSSQDFIQNKLRSLRAKTMSDI